MLTHLNREQMHPGDRICLAISGGADSVALLLLVHAANTLARNALGVGLTAVHIHHGLRAAEADADLAFVQSLCGRLDIRLHIHRVDTAAHAATQRETIEEAARNLRYSVFRSILATGQADAVLTAHTLDDQAETVLMKLLRGAWTEGLSGIHPVVLPQPSDPQRRILRPLLDTRRADLRAWLESIQQPWREDASNADQSFTRNRIRHSVLPMLREENPALDQALANVATLAREDEARWAVELSRILPQMLLPGKPVRGGGRAVSPSAADSSLSIELDRLRPLDPALRRRVLRAAARQLGARLSFDETARILALCFPTDLTVRSRPGSILQLASGLRAERSPRELRLSRTTAVNPT